jgi:pimeloyl-ACP methyl ester carboxylesterase
MAMIKRIFAYLTIVIVVVIGLAALMPERATQMMIGIERAASGLTHQTTIVDGETWHYLEGGPADGEVIVLLHGFGGDKDNWTRFTRSLSKKYHVVAPDLPGFGESAKYADWDYSPEPQRDRLRAFLLKLELDSVHVVGNSMGGYLAGIYAAEYGDDVRSIAFFNTAGIDAPVESAMQRLLAEGKNPLIVDSLEDFDVLLAFVSHKPPFLPWPAKKVFAQKALQNSESNHRIFDGYDDGRQTGLQAVLAGIEQPSLILWGEFDRVLDVSSVDVMRGLLPHAEVVVMKDTGHVPMLERPAVTAAIYAEFLD